MQDNPQLMAEMQQRMMSSAGRAGVDGQTMTRNMQNQFMMMGGRGGGGAGFLGGMMGAMTRGGPAPGGGGLLGPGGGLAGRFGGGGGGGRGGGGPMPGGIGGMTGLPPGMLAGRPGGHLGILSMDAGLRPPMTAGGRRDAGGGLGGGVCGLRGPPDVMRPPMGPSSVSAAPATESTASATELMSGRAGGMVGNLASMPGSVFLGQAAPKKDATADNLSPSGGAGPPLPLPGTAELPAGRGGASLGDVAPPLPPPGGLRGAGVALPHTGDVGPFLGGPGPPLPPAKQPEPLPNPRMLDDDEERALLHGTVPTTSSKSPERDEGPGAAATAAEPEPTRAESRSAAVREHRRADGPSAPGGGGGGEARGGGGSEGCTACEAAGGGSARRRPCRHAFCVTCVQSYFSRGETACPVCGADDDVAERALTTQPATGHMMTTYDNGFRLPGFETTSRGTIVVTYSFPAGTQTVCPHTHTHTHQSSGPLSATTRVSRYQTSKTNLDFTGARDSEWQ